jgi:hypothetical protein
MGNIEKENSSKDIRGFNNSAYRKTFYSDPLNDNGIVVASLNSNTSLKQYIEVLIFDLIKKRNLESKIIGLFTSSSAIKSLLHDLLITRSIIDGNGYIFNTTNKLSIVEIKRRGYDSKYEIFHDLYNDDRISEPDTFIFLNFTLLMNDSSIWNTLKDLRESTKETLWIGLDFDHLNTDMTRESDICDTKIEYIPESPETFEGYVDDDILEGIKQILRELELDENSIDFNSLLSGEIFNKENESYELKIGTRDYIDSEDDEDLVKCLNCEGSGKIECSDCEGTGAQECNKCSGSGHFEGKNCDMCVGSGKLKCETCQGSGKEECSDCEGNGKVEDENVNRNAFYVSIKISRNSLELEIKLNGYSWDGTGLLNYKMHFEEDNIPEPSAAKIESYVEEICERINEYKGKFITRFEIDFV